MSSGERDGNVNILQACPGTPSSFVDSSVNRLRVYTSNLAGLTALAAGNVARSATGSIIAGVDLTCNLGNCNSAEFQTWSERVDSDSLHDRLGSSSSDI
jgi:hypothetical protein